MRFYLLKFFILVSIIFLIVTVEIEACSCVARTSICGELAKLKKTKDTKAVFVGTVRSVERAIEKNTNKNERDPFKRRFNKVVIAVDKSFMGNLKDDVFVYTASAGPACGYRFVSGEKYLIFAYRKKESNSFSTSLCSGNKKFENAKKEIEVLSEYKRTGKIPIKIYGKAIFILEENNIEKQSTKLIKVLAKRMEDDNVFEDTLQSGTSFDFSNLQFGKYWFTIFIDGIEAKISNPVILNESNSCQEVNIIASEKELKKYKEMKL